MSKTTKSERVELQWVQGIAARTRQHFGDALGENMVVSTADTKIYLGEVAGIPCVIIEHPTYRSPARIPLSAVAAFGELA